MCVEIFDTAELPLMAHRVNVPRTAKKPAFGGLFLAG